ncbi:MAG: glycine cleavage T C-terminal barrel domain-containing protein [Longimicrobiales bacterium]
MNASVLRRTDRALLRVYGRDPVRIVQGIITNDIANAPADRAVYAALLTPKGRMVADVRVVRRGADLLLDVPASALDALLALFKRTVPPLFARFEDVTANHAMIGVYGPDALRAVVAVLGSLPVLAGTDGFAAVEHDGGTVEVLTTNDTGSGDVDLIVPVEISSSIEDALHAAGATHIDASTLDVLRIEAGTPRWGAELDETTIPLEAGLQSRAISTGKGCYTGQEVIIRILHRGHVNWQLRGFLLGDAPAPSAGATLTRSGETKTVARITSAAVSPRYAQTIALGYARREIEPGTVLQLADGGTATVIHLPFGEGK